LNHIVITHKTNQNFKMKLLIVLALVSAAVASPTVSGDYGSVGVQTSQDIRGAGGLSALSSYQKAVNTAHSQSFVSRTDYTNNPAIYAGYGLHAPVVAAAAPVVAGYGAAYHAPIAAPVYGAAYHAPIAAPYGKTIISKISLEKN
jgi:hypothetical protein